MLCMIRKSLMLLVVTLFLVGCLESAEQRVRKTFEISPEVSLTEENIKAAVIKKIPIGTKETEIYAIFKALKIGEDDLSSFYPADKKGEIVCRFEFDANESGFVRKHYGIVFQLDNDKILKDVVVHEWLTGP